METFTNNKGEAKVYALGFKTNLEHGVTYTRYINRHTLDSDAIILDIVGEMLRSKYSNITAFYCHNLGGFDIVFLLKALYRHNENIALKGVTPAIIRPQQSSLVVQQLFRLKRHSKHLSK